MREAKAARLPREPGKMEPQLQERYRGLVNEGIAKGRVKLLTGGGEKRQHPRFVLHSTQVWSTVERSYPVVDKSLTGVCFLSAYPFPVGDLVKISMRRFFMVEALVVACEIEETEPVYLEYRYKVRCRFRGLDPSLLQVLVALDLEGESSVTVRG